MKSPFPTRYSVSGALSNIQLRHAVKAPDGGGGGQHTICLDGIFDGIEAQLRLAVHRHVLGREEPSKTDSIQVELTQTA